MICRNVTQARAAAFASCPGAEPAWGGGKGVTPARGTGGRAPGPQAQGPCGEAEGTPGRASAPARCTIPVAGGGQGALCLLGPDPRSSLGQTRGAAWASRAPPQTKNSNSGQVSAAPGTRVADSAPGRRQRRAPPNNARPRLHRRIPGARPGPGTLGRAAPLSAGRHVRPREDAVSALGSGRGGVGRRPGDLGRPALLGAVSLSPVPQSPDPSPESAARTHLAGAPGGRH